MQDTHRLNQAITSSYIETQTPGHAATMRALCTLALVAFVLVIVGGTAAQSNTPHPTLFILTLTSSMLIGFYILMSLLEIKLDQKLMHLKSSLLIWAAFFGGLGIFAKIDAQAEINQIFHVDPSLLPMTLTAATFIHALAKLEPIFYLISVASFIFFALSNKAYREGKRTLSYSVCHLANCLVFLIIALLVTRVMASEERRGEILYRFAHLADFSTFSPCENVNSEEFDVLYLDGNRKRVLIAPRISDSGDIEPTKYPLLKYVPVPKTFLTRECEYLNSAE
ncbi:hypothetical protein HX866_30430 [Pseudomonas gingeri]|uniref:hypothetical protein n=1 Tax=Pseudomonas gingeri TaxID=117681 RepID=UPI0015A43C20|nr:hypothetical protein [Pseudomonas gingeri]NWA29211.1 hypothetical protein [Pseudomonas gingeri]